MSGIDGVSGSNPNFDYVKKHVHEKIENELGLNCIFDKVSDAAANQNNEVKEPPQGNPTTNTSNSADLSKRAIEVAKTIEENLDTEKSKLASVDAQRNSDGTYTVTATIKQTTHMYNNEVHVIERQNVSIISFDDDGNPVKIQTKCYYPQQGLGNLGFNGDGSYSESVVTLNGNSRERISKQDGQVYQSRYTVNDKGLKTQETKIRTIDGQPVEIEMNYQYDENDNLVCVSTQEPAYSQTYYQYDSQNRLISEIRVEPLSRKHSKGKKVSLPYVTRKNYSYDANGRVTVTTYINGRQSGTLNKPNPNEGERMRDLLYYNELEKYMRENGYEFPQNPANRPDVGV